MSAYRSSLAQHVGRTGEPDPSAARRLARDAWHQRGFVAIDPGWLGCDADRGVLAGLAAKVHGPRSAGVDQ